MPLAANINIASRDAYASLGALFRVRPAEDSPRFQWVLRLRFRQRVVTIFHRELLFFPCIRSPRRVRASSMLTTWIFTWIFIDLTRGPCCPSEFRDAGEGHREYSARGGSTHVHTRTPANRERLLETSGTVGRDDARPVFRRSDFDGCALMYDGSCRSWVRRSTCDGVRLVRGQLERR